MPHPFLFCFFPLFFCLSLSLSFDVIFDGWVKCKTKRKKKKSQAKVARILYLLFNYTMFVYLCMGVRGRVFVFFFCLFFCFLVRIWWVSKRLYVQGVFFSIDHILLTVERIIYCYHFLLPSSPLLPVYHLIFFSTYKKRRLILI